MTDRKKNDDKQKENNAYFETFEVMNQEVYAHLLWKNALLKMNPNDNTSELLMLDNTYCFKRCIADDENIYFADNLGKALVKYNLEKKSTEIFQLDANTKPDNNISAMENYDKYIFIVANYKGVIYIYDKKDKTITQDDSVYKEIKQNYGGEARFILCLSVEECLMMKIEGRDTSGWLRYDLSKCCLEKIESGILPESVVAQYYYNGNLYLLENDFRISVWNIEDNKVTSIELPALGQLSEEDDPPHILGNLAVTSKNIWLFPSPRGRDIYIYDLKNNTLKKYYEYPQDFFYLNMKKWSKYSEIKKRGRFIYTTARLANYYLMIDAENGTGVWKSVYVPDFSEYYCRVINQISRKTKEPLNERQIPLPEYLHYLQESGSKEKSEENMGKIMWSKVK